MGRHKGERHAVIQASESACERCDLIPDTDGEDLHREMAETMKEG